MVTTAARHKVDDHFENREIGETMGIRIEPDHLVAFAEDEQHAAASAA